MKSQTIFITWDYNKEEYVWATSLHDLQVESRVWAHNYHQRIISESQYDALKNGGWIAAVTKTGVRVKI